MAKFAIIIGSIREGRVGESAAQWVLEQARARGGEATYDIVDLKDFPLPLLSAPVPALQANKKYDDAQVQAFSDRIDAFDGYIFVTPEYNRNVPGPFKNAFDSLGQEWLEKKLGLVGYGWGGAAGALKGWEMSTGGALKMQLVPTQVSVDLGPGQGAFAPQDTDAAALNQLLDELEA